MVDLNNEIRPNFFIIGAPKCGTTALSEYLRTHPNVFFSNPKEPQYFASDFSGRIVDNLRDYMRLFQNANPIEHLAIGEGSALYIRSNDAVANIMEFQPNAKIIVMLRNPIELVVSLHSEALITSGESIRSFREAWDMEEFRRQGKNLPLSTTDPKHLLYSEWGKLGTQLDRVMKIVPKDNINIILFDDFIADIMSVYKTTLDFLELPYDGRLLFPQVNERRNIRYYWLHRLLTTLGRFWLPARRKLTGGKGLGIVNYIVKEWNSTPAEKAEVSGLRKMLYSYYSSEIILLEELLDKDLSHWMKLPESAK